MVAWMAAVRPRAVVGAGAAILWLAAGATPARAQVERGTVAPLGDRALTVRDQYGGATVTLAVHGDRALVGVGTRAHLIDLSRPATLPLVWQSPPQRQIVRAVALDDAALVVGFESADGLVVYDRTAPDGPRESQQLATGGEVRNLLLTPRRLYVAAYGRLGVFDRTGPAELAPVDVDLPLRGVLALALDGDTLFALEPAVGLHAIDVGDGRPLALLHTLKIPGLNAGALAGDMRLHGTRLYIGAGLGIHVVDVANPRAMTLITSLPPGPTINDVDVIGDRLFAATIQDGVTVYDVAQGDTPVLVDVLKTKNGTTAAAATPLGLLVVDYGEGLARHPIADGVLADAPDARHVATGVVQSVAHVAGGETLATMAGGRFVSLTPGSAGWDAVSLDLPADVQASSIRTDGRWAVVSSPTHGVWRLALSPGERPSLVAATARKGHVGLVLSDGQRIAEAAGFDGLHLLRPDGGELVRETSLPVAGHVSNLAIDGATAFLAARSDGLRVVDLADPARMRVLGSAATRLPARDVAVRDGFAFVVEDDGAFEVFDVRQPAQPRKAGEGWLGGDASRIVIDGRRAYALVEDHKVVPIDIGDPTAPVVGEAREIGDRINDIAAMPGGIVLAAARMGVIAAEAAFAPARATATPDPSAEAFQQAVGTAAAAATATAVARPLPAAAARSEGRRRVATAGAATLALVVVAALGVAWLRRRPAAAASEEHPGGD